MSTLGELKTEIADDMDRSDLGSAIGTEINNAIRHYQSRHFYFTETRDKTFDTVAGQIWYTPSDDADIGKFVSFDFVHITIGNNRYRLTHYPIDRFEILTDANATNGQPYAYTRYNKNIGIFPPADQAYTVRIIGAYMQDGPASDGEADNVWMVDAYNMIRARTLSRLYAYKIHDDAKAEKFALLEAAELERIEAETASRAATNQIIPSYF